MVRDRGKTQSPVKAKGPISRNKTRLAMIQTIDAQLPPALTELVGSELGTESQSAANSKLQLALSNLNPYKDQINS